MRNEISLTLIIFHEMARHNETGSAGEALAAKYFLHLGYEILFKNWRHKHWEIDIIATKNGMLHFIEVKTRTSELFGYPEEKMNRKKIRCMIDASEEFLIANPTWHRIQFDILSIILPLNNNPEYFLIEDVYL